MTGNLGAYGANSFRWVYDTNSNVTSGGPDGLINIPTISATSASIQFTTTDINSDSFID